MKCSNEELKKYQSIFGGKMKVRKGYLFICIILGIVAFALLMGGCQIPKEIGELGIRDANIGNLWDIWLENGIKVKYTFRW